MKEPKKNLQHEFIKELHEYCHRTQNYNLLQHLISTREATILSRLHHSDIGNLGHNFNTLQATEIIGKQPCASLPESYFIIEQLAMKIFGCLLICRTEYEIFKIIHHSTHSLHKKLVSTNQSSHKNTINENYHYELVSDIALEQRYFQTEYSDVPLLLSNAIVLINIVTFIKEHKWYEMLNHLALSSQGEHFILYQYEDHTHAPMLISSALIESYKKKDDWLFFDDFFQSNKWVNENSFNTISSYFPKLDSLLTSTQKHLSLVSVSELENAMFHSIEDKTSICGVIRFTISGQTSKINYHMYLAQKGLANALYDTGRDMIFSIIEQPAMVLFYQAMNSVNDSKPPFLFTSSQDINHTGLVTYKGICLTNNASHAFDQCNFKSYNVNIIRKRKELNKR